MVRTSRCSVSIILIVSSTSYLVITGFSPLSPLIRPEAASKCTSHYYTRAGAAMQMQYPRAACPRFLPSFCLSYGFFLASSARPHCSFDAYFSACMAQNITQFWTIRIFCKASIKSCVYVFKCLKIVLLYCWSRWLQPCGKRRGLGMTKKLIAAGITLLILGLYFFVGTGTI